MNANLKDKSVLGLQAIAIILFFEGVRFYAGTVGLAVMSLCLLISLYIPPVMRSTTADGEIMFKKYGFGAGQGGFYLSLCRISAAFSAVVFSVKALIALA